MPLQLHQPCRHASCLQEPAERTNWPAPESYKRGSTAQLHKDCQALMRQMYVEDCRAEGKRPNKRSVRCLAGWLAAAAVNLLS